MFELALAIGMVAIGLIVLISIAVTALQYPYDTDTGTDWGGISARGFYQAAYDAAEWSALPEGHEHLTGYADRARSHAGAAGIPALVEEFAQQYGLANGRVLEVGAGSGLLQDVVERYTAIDLSTRASRFFHKPFLAASATRLPFRDNTFDGLWSIWVLEHVPNPERALEEMRRVIKPGGHLLLRPAWNCDSWAADGYEVRPYSDLPLKGKLIKASIPIRVSRWYSAFYVRQVRLLRTLATRLAGRPSQLHFTRLRPNYDHYWVTDSDAIVALDFYEVALWFTSRGDDCVNCPSLNDLLFGLPGKRSDTLIVRVNKQA